MRTSSRWARRSQLFINSLVAGVTMVSSLFVMAPAFADSSTIVVDPTHLRNWSTADTRPGGNVSFVTDGTAPLGAGALELTTDSTNAAKVQFERPANVKLSRVAPLSYATKQISAPFNGADPSYQLAVDLDGNGTFDTNLVYEPYENGTVTTGTWQNWDVSDGQFWSSNTVDGLTAGAGGPPYYTLSYLKQNYPHAVVMGFGVNVGTYNPSYDVETDNLVFNGNTYDFEPAATPNVVYVDPAYTYGNSGSHFYGYDAFSTIQAGVNAVADGGKVIVDAGTYTESVTIGKAVKLLGAQSGVDARGRSTSQESVVNAPSDNEANFTVNSSNVTINGFTVNGPSNQGTAAFVMQGDYNNELVTNNIVNDPGRAASIWTDDTTFSYNVVHQTAETGDGFQTNNRSVTNDTFVSNAFDGGSNNNADISILQGTGGDSADITVKNNTSSGDSTLVAFFYTVDATVSNNVVTNPTGSAIYIGGADKDITVKNNVVSNTADSTHKAVNVANDFGFGPNTDVTVHQNQFTDDQYGVSVEAGAITDGPVNAKNNWWGSVTGPTDQVSHDGSKPDTNPLGTGSGAGGAVNYNNWCLNVTCTGADSGDGGSGGGTSGGSGSTSGDTGSSTTDNSNSNSTPSTVSSGTHTAGQVYGGSNSNNDGSTNSVISQILGAATTNPSTTQKPLAVSTHNTKAHNSAKWLGLAWFWWLLIVILLVIAGYSYNRFRPRANA